MAPRNPTTGKARRQKKRKSRTEVSSDSDSSPEPEQQPSSPEVKVPQKKAKVAPSQTLKQTRDAEITEAFTRYYMQRATTEFEEDLDKIRSADDFKGDALALLISALQQGTNVFSKEDKQRVVVPTKSTG